MSTRSGLREYGRCIEYCQRVWETVNISYFIYYFFIIMTIIMYRYLTEQNAGIVYKQ